MPPGREERGWILSGVGLGLAQIGLWAAWLGTITGVVGLLGARTARQVHASLIAGLLVAAYFAVLLASFGLQATIVGPGHYPWLGKALVAAAVVGAAFAGVGPNATSLGLTTVPRPRPLWPILAGIAACLLVSLADPSIPGDPHAPECIAFEATMPGLEEELFFRGLLLATMGDAFPPRWRVLGAPVGWGHLLVVVVFVCGHLFSIDASLRPHVATQLLPAASLLGFAVACTWVRARSGSTWWAVATHNAANLWLVALAWLR